MSYINDWQWIDLAETGSTNDEAVFRSRQLDGRQKLVITAQSQTAGRGRRGRVWIGCEGNLFMSQAVPVELRFLGQIVLLSSLALIRTIDDIKGRLALNMEANSELYNTVCEIEKAILIKYYQYIKQADKFYNENKYLSKKDYAIKGKNELDIVVFPLAMNLFDKGHIDENKYKNNFLKYRLYC